MILEGIADAIVGLAKAAVGVSNVLYRIADVATTDDAEAPVSVSLNGVERTYEEEEPDTDHLEEVESEFRLGFQSPVRVKPRPKVVKQ